MPVGRPWVTRRENALQNIDYSALWSSSRCPEIHAVKAMYLYLFFRANLEDQTASVFIETRCSPSVSTAGEQFAYLTSRIRDRLHLRISVSSHRPIRTDTGRATWDFKRLEFWNLRVLETRNINIENLVKISVFRRKFPREVGDGGVVTSVSATRCHLTLSAWRFPAACRITSFFFALLPFDTLT